MAVVVAERQIVRQFLRERETYVPRPKAVDLIDKFLRDLGLPGYIFRQDIYEQLYKQFPQLPQLPPEQQIEIVAGSSWAHGMASGVCGPNYVGLLSGTPEYEACVYNVSHRAAASALRLPYMPRPTAPPPARPRRRR